jgi:hypothetical protein
MFYVMIGCAALFLGYIVYESIKVAKFMKQKEAMNATLVADRFLVCMLWIFAVLYIIFFAVYFEDALSHVHRFAEDPWIPLFFVLIVFPLFIISWRLVLLQGLYAYNEEALISFAYHSIPFADLTVVKANPNWPYMLKAAVKPDAMNKHANKKITIRTNNSHNFYRLQSLINAENA